MMTKEERLAKNIILKKLAEDGYGSNANTGNKITYTYLLNFFDIHLTSDPQTIAYVRFDKAEITINRNLDIDQVSFVIRHEILHQYLEHSKRFEQYYTSKGKDFSKITSTEHMLQNMAADYEISNRGYTDKDKRIAKGIKLSTSPKPLEGLVTDIDHPEWVNMSMEEMYDELDKENETTKELLKQMLENNPQLDQPGNQDYQDIEDIERTAKSLEEEAEDLENQSSDMKKDSKDSSKEGNSGEENNNSDKNSPSSQDSSSNKKSEDESSSGDKSNESNPSENESESDDSEDIAKNLKQRAKELKEVADKLKKASKEEKEKLKDSIKRNEKSPLRTKREVKEDADLQERIKKLKELAESEQAKKDIIDITAGKVYDDQLKASEKELRKYRRDNLVGFALILNKLIKNQIGTGKNKTWTKINKKYSQSSILKPGTSRLRDMPVPVINVYFDMSGSVEPYVDSTKKALNTLNDYLRQGKIKVNIKYVTTVLSSNPDDMTGGGADGNLIMEDIIKTKPTNVVIMTDGDSNYGTDRFNPVLLTGGVIILCPNPSYLPDELIKKVKGRQLNQLFIIEGNKASQY